jgi:drug/metabolite transporter (DMT)-like permease
MHILWFPLTLFCAFSLATCDALTKKALAARHNEYLIAWIRLLLMLPFLVVLLLALPKPGLYPILLFLCLTPVALWKGRHELRHPGLLRATMLPALFSLGETLSGVIAMSLTNVAYMIAVKRLSLLMGIVYGHFMFREEGLRERLVGGGLMLAGVAFIVFGVT